MAASLIWFRQDLRLHDNPCLILAVQRGQPIYFLYLHEEELGSATQWWLHYSLLSLQKQLKALRATLILERGKRQEVIPRLIKRYAIDKIYAHQPVPHSLTQQWENLGCSYEEVEGNFLSLPGSMRTAKGSPFLVFTPYLQAFYRESAPRAPLPAPSHLPLHGPVSTLSLSDLDLLSHDNFSSYWTPGEQGALERLRAFKSKIALYERDRDRPDTEGTSLLSPHLHFGEISPFTIWHTLEKQEQSFPFLRQLIWREFAAHLLHFFPSLPKKPLQASFASFPWRHCAATLKRWQQGMTGYPIIDAGMRQLLTTGWMHNRVRMLVASFLIKDLGINWVEGEKWFSDKLVDADNANNALGWQWVAGCGSFAAPYFRIFNPISQSKKFDPEGIFLRTYLPELTSLPNEHLHTPWLAPPEVLAKAGVVLGTHYPYPLIDHAKAKEEALHRYKEWQQHG